MAKTKVKAVQKNELVLVGVDVTKSLRLQITVNGKLEYLELDENDVDELEQAIEEARW